jgi:ADP-ribose pyrophosphatase
VPKKTPFRLKNSRLVYQGRIFRVVQDRFTHVCAGDRVVTRDLIKHPGAAVVVPFLEKNKILLLRQFRYAARGELWEIPAGTLERGESPLECVRREIEEETGFRAKRFKRFASFYSAPGISDERMFLYGAYGLTRGKMHLDPDEWLRPRAVSLREALRMVERGLIRDAKTIIGILWAAYLA